MIYLLITMIEESGAGSTPTLWLDYFHIQEKRTFFVKDFITAIGLKYISIELDYFTSDRKYSFLTFDLNTNEHLKEYIHTLQNQSFDGWTDEAKQGYQTALISINNFLCKTQ